MSLKVRLISLPVLVRLTHDVVIIAPEGVRVPQPRFWCVYAVYAYRPHGSATNNAINQGHDVEGVCFSGRFQMPGG